MTSAGARRREIVDRLVRAAVLVAVVICAYDRALAQDDGLGPERIVDFASTVRVGRDGRLDVNETIRVVARGERIVEGIVRELPAEALEHAFRADGQRDEVLLVERDGEREPYTVDLGGEGVRIRIGVPDLAVDPGLHVYRLHYRSGRIVRFHGRVDEVRWAVTGFAWRVPIDAASVTVHLPSGLRVVRSAAFVGMHGTRSHHGLVGRAADGSWTARTEAPLSPGRGLAVALDFPSGVVRRPGALDGFTGIVPSTAGDAVVAGTFLLVLLTFGVVFADRSREFRTKPGTGSSPSAGLSPAMVRAIDRLGVDRTSFVVAIVGAAARGAVRIDVANGVLVLERGDGPGGEEPAPADEQLVLDMLIGDRPSAMVVHDRNGTVRKTREEHERFLTGAIEAGYVRTGAPLILWSWLLLVAACITAGVLSDAAGAAYGMLAMALVPVTIASAMVVSFLDPNQQPDTRQASLFMAMGLGAVGALFLVGLAFETSAFVALVIVATHVLFVVFARLLRRPTMLGREVMITSEEFRRQILAGATDANPTGIDSGSGGGVPREWLAYAIALDCCVDASSLGPLGTKCRTTFALRDELLAMVSAAEKAPASAVVPGR